MSKLIETMQGMKNFHALAAASDEQIELAQKQLGLTFSGDYKEYISNLGAATFSGHELTGICASPRLNVVNVTERCRASASGIDPAWYVLEELNIDEVTIWQAGDGSVYQVMSHAEPVKIAQGLIEYISL